MSTVELSLTVSPEIYEALEAEAKKEKKSPEALSVEILLDFLEHQRQLAEGRRVLRMMPKRAVKRRAARRTDTARRHDDYLYGREPGSARL
jgi:hypothetical protein